MKGMTRSEFEKLLDQHCVHINDAVEIEKIHDIMSDMKSERIPRHIGLESLKNILTSSFGTVVKKRKLLAGVLSVIKFNDVYTVRFISYDGKKNEKLFKSNYITDVYRKFYSIVDQENRPKAEGLGKA